VVRGLQVFEFGAQFLVRRRIGKIRRQIRQATDQAFQIGFVQRLRVVLVGRKGADGLLHVVLEGLIAHLQQVHADQCKVVGQQVGARQVVQRGHDQSFGQVTACAKNHNGARRRSLAMRRGFVFDIVCHGLPYFLPGSWWPPNCLRMADSIFSAKVCSLRERKRVYSAAVSTSAGTASSIAA